MKTNNAEPASKAVVPEAGLAKGRIPLVIGITGHRRLRPEDRPALAEAVRGEYRRLKEQYPHSPLVLLDSLAEGADLLCADAAEELGIPLIAVLPRELTEYENDFSAEALPCLRHHAARAMQCFVAPFCETEQTGISRRDYEFRQAGIYVATHCHVLMALWDGEPGEDGGCGTAEAVDFVLHGNYSPLKGAPLRSETNEAVIHIYTPRGESAAEPPASLHYLGNREAVRDVLQKTEEFNRSADTLPEKERPTLRGEDRREERPDASAADRGGPDPVSERVHAVGRLAGTLSMRSARLYRRILACLAVASALLTFAFLMYDEAQSIWMILVCGVMIGLAFLLGRFAARSDCHRRYIEYRALAEVLRVQYYLRRAGSAVQAADLLSWTQQEETAWILDALCALSIGAPPLRAHDIRADWVDEQRDYHRQAAVRSRSKLRVSEQTVRIALGVSITLYLAAVAFELLCGGLIFEPCVTVADTEAYRTLLKILLGTISAVTLFVANYYGKLSLPRILSDHGKMARFYSKMSALLQKHGQTDELLTVLAREELIENGNWVSYERDNTPDVSF